MSENQKTFTCSISQNFIKESLRRYFSVSSCHFSSAHNKIQTIAELRNVNHIIRKTYHQQNTDNESPSLLQDVTDRAFN